MKKRKGEGGKTGMKYQFDDTRMQYVAVPTRVIDGLLGIATGAQLKVLLF